MKFARTDLIDRVKAEIARREKATADRNAKATAHADKRRTEYLAKTTDAWTVFANTIRRRVRAGQPVTAADIPIELRGGYIGRGAVHVWDEPPAADHTPDIGALTLLLDLLEASTDDEVTTNALERAGFRTARLFSHP